jgi:hypothetical protein
MQHEPAAFHPGHIFSRRTSLSAEYSDFRKVGGAMFPFRVTNYAGDRRIAETVMNTYRINPPVPDSLFAP